MKKIYFFIVFLYSLSLSAQSPGFGWAGGVGGAQDEAAYDVATDANGNVYVLGSFRSNSDFDIGSGVTSIFPIGTYSDIFISMYDSIGNFVWVKTIGGAADDDGLAIAVDASGNIYVAGSFSLTVDFDPGIAVYNLSTSGPGTRDLFVLKLDSSGGFLWARDCEGTLANAAVNELTIDIFGNVYLGGTFDNTVDFDSGPGVYSLTAYSGSGCSHAFVLKLDLFGNFIWARKFGGTTGTSNTMITSIITDAFGNVYTTGSFNEVVDFDPGLALNNVASAGDFDIFISRLDVTGNFSWVKTFGGTGNDGGKAISMDANGNIYYSAGFVGPVDFDPSAASYLLSGYGVTSKLDPSGNLVWAHSLSYANAYDLKLDPGKNVYTVGYFSGTVDFDPGASVFSLSDAGGGDFYVSKVDSLGNFNWARNFGSSGYELSWAMALDPNLNIYVAGVFRDTVDFDPSLAVSNLLSNGANDFFIQKLLPNEYVWPGDADNDNVANNNDFLPIGIYFGQTGPPRSTVSNSWQAYSGADWGILQGSSDIKHIDCNGDGNIDNNDTVAINLNFSSTHAYAPSNSDVRVSGPDLYFVTSSSFYFSGNMVDVEVWAGNSTNTVSDLYGIAFDINYDASLVQPGSESLNYPLSWLGTPGTDAITIAKINALGNTAYGAETKINHVNSDGFGKIADFKFQVAAGVPANTPMTFTMSGYQANDSAGAVILFNTPGNGIVINPSSVGLNMAGNDSHISVYPNPTNGSFTIYATEPSAMSIEVYNTIGELVLASEITNQRTTLDLTGQPNGLYFVKVANGGKFVGTKKVVKN